MPEIMHSDRFQTGPFYGPHERVGNGGPFFAILGDQMMGSNGFTIAHRT
jgi:hypothetical protein